MQSNAMFAAWLIVLGIALATLALFALYEGDVSTCIWVGPNSVLCDGETYIVIGAP